MRCFLGLLTVFLLTASSLPAQPPQEPVRLTIRPAGEPEPALKYLLLPNLIDQTPGNAALFYYRAFSPEWWASLYRSDFFSKVDDLLKKPLKDLPQQELSWPLGSKQLQELDLAARREYCDWEIMQRARSELFQLLLPDLQSFRTFANLLALRARLEMAQGNFDAAVHTLQTGFAIGRHVSQHPTLIGGLVGIAITQVMATQLEELIQTPGSPNLYWALTDLPSPYVDLRKAYQFERMVVSCLFPPLRELENAPMSKEQAFEMVDKAFQKVGSILDSRSSAAERQFTLMALAAPVYTEAKRALIAAGRRPEDVEAMPVLQVFAIHSVRQYQRVADHGFKGINIPARAREFRPGYHAPVDVEAEIKNARARFEMLPSLLFPALQKVRNATLRLDRRIAALRVIEAIRMYAAGHDGKLPASLNDIAASLPLPYDPATGKDFEYAVDGNKALLFGPAPGGANSDRAFTIHYELTLTR